MHGDTKIVYMLEDDADDRSITEHSVAELRLNIDIRFFSDSNRFLHFLETADTASLILLDYNSKPDNGLEVLKKIKSDDRHNGIPVVILSDSTVKKYRAECYAHGASSFIRKPSRVDKTNATIKAFFDYWFHVVEV